MALKKYIGSGGPDQGDLSVAANWSPGVVPIAGEEVVIDPDDSTENITKGLTPGVIWGQTLLAKDYTGTFGNGTGDPVVMGAEQLVIECGSENVYIKGVASPNHIVECIVRRMQSGSGTAKVHLDGTIDEISISDWLVDLNDMITDRLVISPAVSKSPTVRSLGNDQIDLIFVTGGTLVMTEMDATTLHQYGGTITHGSDAACVVDNIVIFDGVYTWNGSATIAVLDCYGGTFDASQSAILRTITKLDMFENSTVNLDNGVPLATTVTTFRRFGGVLTLPAGSEVSIA